MGPRRAIALPFIVAVVVAWTGGGAAAQHVLYTFDGDSPYDLFGRSVSGAGDVNNDGYDDLIVGASDDDNNGDLSGSARVYSGLDGSILYTFNGDSADDRLGRSVSGAGDVNNDGYDDLIAGAYYDDNNGAYSGSARVFSGICGDITDFGAGCPGNGGCIPELTVNGCAAVRCPLAVKITNGEGGAATLLLLAPSPDVGGHLLHPSCYVDVPLPPIGGVFPLIPLPGAGPCNGEILFPPISLQTRPITPYLQVVVRDSTVGWITTNGVSIQIP